MRRRFVIEAVLIASYGHLLFPGRPIDFIIPYASIAELYDMRDSTEPIMEDADDDQHVRAKISELIQFFEEALNRKKIEKALGQPWRESAPLLLNDEIQLTVIYAVDNAQYGELFDPIETELLLTASRLSVPLLTDQIDLQDRLIESEVPIQVYDIEDFEFAVEDGIPLEELGL